MIRKLRLALWRGAHPGGSPCRSCGTQEGAMHRWWCWRRVFYRLITPSPKIDCPVCHVKRRFDPSSGIVRCSRHGAMNLYHLQDRRP